MSGLLRNRRGSMLTELLVVMTVMGIVGAAMTGLLVSQSRFFNDQEGQANARRVARGGSTMLFSDLRMVEASNGLVAASPTSFTIRVPYRVGVVCGTSGGNLITTMQPVDSLILAGSGYNGYAWIDSLFAVHYVEPGGTLGGGSPSTCISANVDTIPGGTVMSIASAPAGANPGSPIFLYHQITYSLGASTTVPGTIGLFRTVLSTSTTDEIVAPFDSTASFRYHMTGGGAPVTTPSPLSLVRGIEFNLTGLNERNVTNGKTQRAPLTTSVFFENR